MSHNTKDPTRVTYVGLTDAYDWFNRKLFDGALPAALITMQRRRGSYGYFAAERFGTRDRSDIVDEIALNPVHFEARSDDKILSTLVHEMCHLWQFRFGKPSRSGYHNKEWADRMESLGLMPSSTGGAGGKRTGQRMSHYIIEGGAFDLACRRLLEGGFKLNWQSLDPAANGRGPDRSKTKFICLECGQNAWAKSGASLLCGLCGEIMVGVDGTHGPYPAYRTDDSFEPEGEQR